MIKTIRLLTVFFLLLTTVDSYSQRRYFSSIKIVADTSQTWFITGVLPLGAEVTYVSGKKRRTTGYLNGNLRWKNVELISSQGEMKGDAFIIDLEKAQSNKGKVEITAFASGDSSGKSTFTLHIPKLVRLALLLPKDIKIKPGTVFSPDVSLYYSNRQEYQASPWKSGSFIKPESLRLFNGKEEISDGIFAVPNDFLEAGDFITLSVVSRDDPKIFDVKIYAINYDFTLSYRYNIEPGSDGAKGKDGAKDQTGGDGISGESGEDAPNAYLFMWLSDSTNILHINLLIGKEQKQFMLKAGNGKFEIDIRGGNGGNGGNGGDGGDASSYSNSTGGFGGNGGDGGSGGRGSKVTIYCDVNAEKYLPQLHINNLGGDGGKGGIGGKGGRVISFESSSFFDFLFPSRNENGYYGLQGDYGTRGPEAEIILLSAPEVIAKFEWMK